MTVTSPALAPAPASALDALAHARAVLAREGVWFQRAPSGPGRSCLVQAILSFPDQRVAYTAVFAAARALTHPGPSPYDALDASRALMAFNDLPSTTLEDVDLLLKRTAHNIDPGEPLP